MSISNISVSDSLIKVKKGNVLYENNLNDSAIVEIQNLGIELIDSLIKLNFDWKKNDNLLVFNVVSKLVKYVGKFKKLNFDEKKILANKVLKKIFEKIIKIKNLDSNLSNILMDGFDIVIEPSIDLALQTVNNKVDLKDNFKNCFKLCK